MSNANTENNECHDGVCKTDFKPGRVARDSFQNLRTLAGGFIDKVKETLTGDSQDELTAESEAQKAHLSRMGDHTTKNSAVCSSDNHVSIHKSDIIDRFVQSSWNAETRSSGSLPALQVLEQPKLINVRQRSSEGQLKPSRYSNPWRYDNRH